MTFAHPLPWWLAFALAATAVALALHAYRRPLVPISARRRATLVALRAMVIAAIVFILFRPVILLPPANAPSAVVPVLLDVSRSMRLRDVDGQSRLASATDLVQTEILPVIAPRFRSDVFSVGEDLTPVEDIGSLKPEARHTDLAGAVAAIGQRYRGRLVAAIVVLSDGGDTGQRAPDAYEARGGPPVFAVGIGSPDGVRDREVLGVTAGDPGLDQSSIDLQVSAVSNGFGRTPFELRVLANGRVVETRRVAPLADGSPIEATFTVSPDLAGPTVYTADIPSGEGEPVVENNARSVLVGPVGRKRRVLMLEGAPGFEHSFLNRALARDPGLEIDSVLRKGKNAEGRDTFLVQAGEGRTSALVSGFPSRREDLYAYDAIVIANVEGDFFTRAQLSTAADFVAERGGGLLVLGGRSFTSRGLIGTPLDEVLPVELNDRRGAGARSTPVSREADASNSLMITADGENHPVMRIGGSREDTLKLWADMPPLAGSAPLGGPRPGATVLAVMRSPAGATYPVVAVQRYGQGRSMIFAGEASWRWRMFLAATDRTYERFWRQAGRWLARPSPDPVAVNVSDAAEPDDSIEVDVDVRDGAFAPVADASVDATLISPRGETRRLTLRRGEAAGGRFAAVIRVGEPGLYRIHAEARRSATRLGAADRWFLVGGVDREFADPRLNEGFLRRMARASGGSYVRGGDVRRIASWLRQTRPPDAVPQRRDLWHTPWTFAFIIALLSMEWILRRRWGLR